MRGVELMADGQTFDPELLKRPQEARQQWFDGLKLLHKRLEEASKQIMKPIRARAGAEVVHVVGPTGVGKTTLMEHVMSELIKLVMPELKKDPGLIPTAFITCQSPTKGGYDWTEHFIRILLALNEVLVDRKIYIPDAGPMPDEVKALVRKDFGKVGALRRAAESAIKNRKLRAFFADEAQYILKGSSGERIVDLADAARSIASESALLVLLGHYDLLELMRLNGQLGRRCRTVHFTRYYIDREEDRKEFGKVFNTLQSKLPLPNKPRLEGHLEFAFERTVGCVGRLKNWFSRCLDTAMTNNCKTVTYEIFEEDADDISVCRQTAIETSEGEDRLKRHEDETAEGELRMLLKEGVRLIAPSGGGPNVMVGQPTAPSTVAGAENTQPKKRPSKKIKTKPHRFTVGGTNVAG